MKQLFLCNILNLIIVSGLSVSFVQKENETTPDQTGFKKYKPCSFGISLPSSYKIKPMEKESNFDYCDYSVKTAMGKELMQIHSTLSSKYMDSDIKTLYNEEIKNVRLDIIYKIQKTNWFVISGTNSENGNTIYYKTIAGNRFISDLRIEYPKSLAPFIEPYIGKIAGSFTSD